MNDKPSPSTKTPSTLSQPGSPEYEAQMEKSRELFARMAKVKQYPISWDQEPAPPVPDWPHVSTDDPIFSNTLGLRGPLLGSYVRPPNKRQPAQSDGEAAAEE